MKYFTYTNIEYKAVNAMPRSSDRDINYSINYPIKHAFKCVYVKGLKM